ncbi:MAG: ROK family protein [Clostridiaceae bacterium]|nr:ROK family protein [Clostridiaceae bacterium]
MNYSIGIDIGGTKVNIGIVDQSGNIKDKVKIPTQTQVGAEDNIRNICENVKKILYQNSITLDQIHFVGVGVPGTVDINTGFIEYCPNLRWENVPGQEIFLRYLGRQVKIVQDSRAATLAEHTFGAGRGFSDMVCITLGTGIGCGIIINNKLFHGGMNTAGEAGHTVVVKGGRLCSCGNRGCLERYSSGSGILEQALERFPEKFEGREKSSEYIFKIAKEGDAQALQLIRESVEYLALGIANLVGILSPQAVVISGGMCVHEDLIIDPLRELVNKYGYFSWTRKNQLKIMKAELGSDAPMIGAASLYRALE